MAKSLLRFSASSARDVEADSAAVGGDLNLSLLILFVFAHSCLDSRVLAVSANVIAGHAG